MQTLFDLSMPASLSYIVAIIVILGLLALFAIIVRRVASQGLRPEGGRGRGPRLGVVDTYSLDRNRQLVIVRRDDVEHLLMIGGTNDILIESNIVRAIGAQAIREQQSPLIPVQPPVYQQFDTPQVPHDDEDTPFIAPQPATPVAPAAPQAPRLKPLAAPPMPQAQMRPVLDTAAPQAPAQAPQQQVEMAAQPAQAREALNNAELQALAKRLEASIPPMPAPKSERPAPQPVNVPPQPEPKAPPVAPQFQPAQVPPAPVQPPHIQPPAMQQPQPAPHFAPSPVPQQAPHQPVMPQPRPPMPAPQVAQPMPAPPMQVPPMPFPQQKAPAPQAAPQPVSPPPPPVEPAKDRQASALDENLRRLLGRKLDPR